MEIQKKMSCGFYDIHIAEALLGFMWVFPLFPFQDIYGRTKNKAIVNLGIVHKDEVGLDTKIWIFEIVFVFLHLRSVALLLI